MDAFLTWLLQNGEHIGIVTLLLLIGVGGAQKLWVWGWLLVRQEQLTAEWKASSDKWEKVALDLLQTAHTVARQKGAVK